MGLITMLKLHQKNDHIDIVNPHQKEYQIRKKQEDKGDNYG